MGHARPRPVRLAAKLLQIRLRLRLTQEQMFVRLNYKESPLHLTHISGFENGKREPPLQLLLRYARVADLPLEYLVDDALDLPETPVLPENACPSVECDEQPEDDAAELPAPQMIPKCPYCGAMRRQIRSGLNRAGTQRYQCRKCDRHYTPDPASNAYSEEVRRKAVLLYENGVRNFRLIGYVLNVNHQSAANWVKAHLAQHSRQEIPQPDLAGASLPSSVNRRQKLTSSVGLARE